MALQVKIGAEISEAISGIQKVDKALQDTGKATQDLASVADASSSRVTKSIEKIALSAIKGGDTIESAFSGLSSLNFDTQFSAAQSRISEAIDKMVSDATRGGAAISTLSKNVSAFGGGVGVFTKGFKDISAATVDGIKSLDQLEAEIAQLQNTLNKSTNVTQIKALGQQIDRLRTQANNLKVVGLETTLGKIGASAGLAGNRLAVAAKSSNQANNALLGMSRVVQDLPYGFQGIANNLTELPQLFRQVSVTAKETGKSIGSVLLQSLKGAGGFGLVFSAVTTALTFATVGISAWTRGLGSSSAAAKKAKEDTDSYKESLKNAFSETAKELANVSVLVELFNRENTSRKEKINIIKELQSIAPGYFAQLNEEKTTIGQLTQAYDRYLASLGRSIEARVVEKQLTDVIEKRLKLENAIGGSNTEQVLINGKLVRVQKVFYGTQQQILANQNELNNLKFSETVLTKRLASLQPPQFKQTDFDPKKVKESTGNVKELARAIQELFNVPPDLKFSLFDTEKQELEKAKKTIEQIKTFFKNTKFTTKLHPVIVPLSEPPPIEEIASSEASNIYNRAGAILGEEFTKGVNSINEIGQLDQSLIDIQRLEAEFKAEFEALGQRMPKIDLAKSFEVNHALLKEKLYNLQVTVSSGLESVLNNAFQGIAIGFGEELGNILSATDQIGKSIMNAIGSLITDLGKALIKYGAVKAGLDKILGPGGIAIPGGVAIALGIAAVAAGQAFKNFGGFRAAGGPVQAGRGYIVGENGPEYFQPAVSGNIVPNDKFSMSSRASAFGGGQLSIALSTRIRGSHLYLSNQREGRRQRRVA
jgi:hypothetical protein